MVDRYMQQERTVIIAVVPANVDMHNTEILQAAQEADPNGTRTIAVVTKVDLVDAGAELAVHELLVNKKKRMHLGYHAVKCRSQRELTKGTTIEKGVANELAFFGQHEYWRKLPTQLWGVPRLSERLVSILQDNIRRSLPKVIAEISALITETQKALSTLGMPLESPGAQRQRFGQWAYQYLRLMEATMGGQYDLLPPSSKRRRLSEEENSPCSSQLEANARLRAALRVEEDVFRKTITKAKYQIVSTKAHDEVEIGDAVQVLVKGCWCSGHVEKVDGSVIICKEYSSTWRSKECWRFDERPMLKKFIQANRGDELAIFPSYQVFSNLFRQCVEKWEPPTKKLVQVYHDHTKLVSDYVADELNAASRVAQFIKATTAKVLDAIVEVATQEVNTLLRGESCPYTQDQRLFTELDQQRLRDLQEQVKADVHTDAKGRVALDEVMNAVASGVLSTKDREVIEMQTA
ncbi:hypothetical protein ON010_g15971 [Phytophthora cinnamomi]|nr:hypothetical protein ON010_g15971 [Phytophthora cinnamomi]